MLCQLRTLGNHYNSNFPSLSSSNFHISKSNLPSFGITMGSNVYQAHWLHRLEYRMLCSGLSYQRPYAKKCSNHLCFLSCTHNLLVRTTSSVSGPFPIQVFSNRKSWFLPKQRVPHWKYWCARCAFWFVINARRNLIILHYLKLKTSLHPNISIYILHTFLCTILLVLTRRICLTIKGS